VRANGQNRKDLESSSKWKVVMKGHPLSSPRCSLGYPRRTQLLLGGGRREEEEGRVYITAPETQAGQYSR